MIKMLLEKLFKKIKNESDCDKKTKNGISIYFVEKILEEQFGKSNYISPKTIKGYYDKYVLERENNSGEPSYELKNLISHYLGYENYLDFENNKKALLNTNSNWNIRSTDKRVIITGVIVAISFFLIILKITGSKDCLVWKKDHYEEIDCDGTLKDPLLSTLDIKKFRQIIARDTTTFFIKGKPIIWYGKSKNGKFEYFNSRGLHPITKKELKPITKYIIHKYIYNKE